MGNILSTVTPAAAMALFRRWSLASRVSNGFAGPWLAKLTRAWKLLHLLRGDYKAVLAKLHAEHGPIVQVGPREFSLSGHEGRLRFVSRQQQAASVFWPPAVTVLQEALTMKSLGEREATIERTNQKLQKCLSEVAFQKQEVDVTKIITRYAYDLVTATTTGESAGFLDTASDPAKIDRALKDWKFNAIIYGSYLRFHPFIKSVLERCGFGKAIKQYMPASDTDTNQNGASDFLNNFDLESQIVLSLAGADPAIILITKAVHYVYKNPDILKRLRAEFKASGVSNTPTFKELLLNQLQMQFMHAILLECKRIHPIYISGLSYIAPDDGINASGMQIPPGKMATPVAVVEHINPEAVTGDKNAWDPTRWLSGTATAELKNLIPAFNIKRESDEVADFHTLIACKVITLFINNFDITGDDLKSAKIHVTADATPIPAADHTVLPSSSADVSSSTVTVTVTPSSTNITNVESGNNATGFKSNVTNVTIPSINILQQYLGKAGTTILLKQYDPDSTAAGAFGGPPLRSRHIEQMRDFLALKDGIKSIYKNRLWAERLKDNTVLIGTKNSVMRAKNNPRQDLAMLPRDQQQVSENQATKKWGDFSKTEHARQESFKTPESWAEQKRKIEENKSTADQTCNTRFKETFKLTGSKKVETKVVTAPAAPKAKVLPPHLRKKAEQELQADWVKRSAVSPVAMPN